MCLCTYRSNTWLVPLGVQLVLLLSLLQARAQAIHLQHPRERACRVTMIRVATARLRFGDDPHAPCLEARRYVM